MNVEVEPIKARYLRMELQGRPHRVYVEEAGEGIPLFCLHTAGSDTRQWRHLLNDPRVLEHFRVITFDMPWHGKTSPASGWQRMDYELTSDLYTETVLGMLDALSLERPVLMGCSIGGRIVLRLAAEEPERFRALIGLQSGPHVDPYYDLQYLHRPDVHGGEMCAALMSGLVGPHASELDRGETLWHYAQSGPGVFKGDLHFYKGEGDLRGQLSEIDTARCPLYLLSGEYDYSCLPTDTLAVADAVPGSTVAIMSGLGHFPMSENHEMFYAHLGPVLDEIRARG
jgi:pimeloyl-ACP methyl ester carboxylesterase